MDIIKFNFLRIDKLKSDNNEDNNLIQNPFMIFNNYLKTYYNSNLIFALKPNKTENKDILKLFEKKFFTNEDIKKLSNEYTLYTIHDNKFNKILYSVNKDFLENFITDKIELLDKNNIYFLPHLTINDIKLLRSTKTKNKYNLKKDLKNIYDKIEYMNEYDNNYNLESLIKQLNKYCFKSNIEEYINKFRSILLINDDSFIKNLIEKIFINLNNDKYLFELFNRFLLMYNYSYYILNNPLIMNRMRIIMWNKKTFYKYILKHAIKLHINTDLYCYEAINNLIIYDLDISNNISIKRNPYIETKLNINDFSKSCLSLNLIDEYNLRFFDNDQFENNFKLFNKGQTFDFINWDNLYLTGNFITACCINSPLINLVKKYMIDEVDYELYLEEYYENRVYEFIYDNNENSNKNFLNKVNELMTELEDKFKIQKIKMNYTVQINLSNEFIEKNNYDLDNLTKDDKEKIYILYIQAKIKKKNGYKSILTNKKLYTEYSKINTLANITVGKSNNNDNDNEIIEVIDNFELNNDLLNYNFKIINKHSTVINISEYLTMNKIDCEQGYYKDNKLYLTTECLKALLTQTNMNLNNYTDYKIIHEYRIRGYSTLLYETSMNNFKKYIESSNQLQLYYEGSNIKGYHDINSKLFKNKQIMYQLEDNETYNLLEYKAKLIKDKNLFEQIIYDNDNYKDYYESYIIETF